MSNNRQAVPGVSPVVLRAPCAGPASACFVLDLLILIVANQCRSRSWGGEAPFCVNQVCAEQVEFRFGSEEQRDEFR